LLYQLYQKQNKLENYAIDQSIETIYLNSRESALKFYIKNGYKIIKKSHVLFGNLQHWLMIKNIQKMLIHDTEKKVEYV